MDLDKLINNNNRVSILSDNYEGITTGHTPTAVKYYIIKDIQQRNIM